MIIDRDQFGTNTGWTEAITSGSYAVSNNQGVYTPGAGGLDTNSAYRTAGTATVAAGYTFQESFIFSSGTGNNWMIGIVNAAGTGYAGSYAAYLDNGAKRLFAWDSAGARNGNVAGVVNLNEGVTHTVIFAITAGGVATMTVDGVLIDQSVTFSGLLGDTIYFLRGNVDSVDGTAGTLKVSEYVATDDGDYTPDAPANLVADYDSGSNQIVCSCDAVPFVDGYVFILDGTTQATVGSPSHNFDAPTPGSHSVTVKAQVDLNGVTYLSSESSPVTVNVPAAGGNDDGEAMLVLGEL